jgi:hypothetical protein
MPESKRLVWDADTKRYYETGCDMGVLYPKTGAAYGTGEAWDGLISVTKSPSGAEATPLWANNRKYGNLYSAEEFGFSIEAYQHPDSFNACLGVKEVAAGVYVGQQTHEPFGMAYRNFVGNDAGGTKSDYIITLIYGATAAPAEETDTTINDSPEAKTMSYECTTTPVTVTGCDPTSKLEIDSRKTDKAKLKQLEDILYGSETAAARLPLPDEVIQIIGAITNGEDD